MRKSREFPWVSRCLLLAALFVITDRTCADQVETHGSGDVSFLIEWLLEEDRDLTGIPFAKVVEVTSGNKVVPVDPNDPVDAAMIQRVGEVMEEVLSEVNEPDHPIHRVGRINEVSGHLEDIMMDKLNESPGWACEFPLTAAGRVQRAGYPDLRLTHEESGRIYYLDPKLHREGSEQSTFRTFYFEPKRETNKINDDAAHIIIGVSHAGREEGNWSFTGWNLVDLAEFQVRLKAEFQASNRDLYRPEAIIHQSESGEEQD